MGSNRNKMNRVKILIMKKVNWMSISPIFADVIISPWNLLVGGLLIKYLSTFEALTSIIIGYFILTLIFYYYGGIGFQKKMQSADIFSKIFGSKISRYLIPSILALGQIGWASINIELGGKSFSNILSMPITFGILLYALALIIIAALDLTKMGIAKFIITASSLLLLIYVFVTKMLSVPIAHFISYQPVDHRSFLWGISIIVASLISFATVAPDFFMNVKSKNDVFMSSFLGIFIPGIITAFLGCFLFFNTGNFNLIALIGSLTFPIFPHILNALTNTDGSTAIYTPGLKIKKMFNLNLTAGIIIAGLISSNLSSLQMSNHLETWLQLLSLMFSSLIGISILKVLFLVRETSEEFNKYALNIFVASVLISLVMTKFFPPVLISLFIPTLLYKGFEYIRSFTHLNVVGKKK